MQSIRTDDADGAELDHRPGPCPSIAIISLSSIADDPRVRRQGDAFLAAGWNVIGIGLPGARSQAPSWLTNLEAHPGCLSHGIDRAVVRRANYVSTTINPLRTLARATGLDGLLRWGLRQPGGIYILNWVLRRAGQVRHLARLQAPRLSPRFAEPAYWSLNSQFERLYSRAVQYRADVWLANDWTALPIARRLAQQQGAALVYDTHELASDEYAEQLRWRFLHRPVVVALERACLPEAALVTCVSDGIADRLQELYGLIERPLVIRNTPNYHQMPFRPTGERVEVLYHGVVSPGRGLEESIRSVALWRPEFRLTIRGPGSEDYCAKLHASIATAGVAGRVRFLPAVPMTALVREANAFDIGIFALPAHSQHNKYALPNKFFEYMMAGLALCVSDLPEMSRLMRAHDLGRSFVGVSPDAIASAINSFDRQSINHYKQRALATAQELNWELECKKLISRCESLVQAAKVKVDMGAF
jgi:glycosyltransferase involved in cell wall biosynthesis